MARNRKLGDPDVLAAAPMAVAWRHAAEDLRIRFESPFCMEFQGRKYWCSGWLPDFGCPQGAIIAGRDCADEIFDISDALGYYASGLSPYHYETYDRERFRDTLNDWGWFGKREDAPEWFAGRFGAHGGPSEEVVTPNA